MKKYLLLIFIVAFAACQSNPTTTATADTTKVTYAYTIAHPDEWDWGSKANTQAVLKSLKAMENGNIEETMAVFADSILLEMDGFEKKMSKDELKAMWKSYLDSVKNMTIQMNDFESVKSKDTKEEWVSLWYKQILTTPSGKVDSIECMDDLKMENGKVTLLNEKRRHYATSKSM